MDAGIRPMHNGPSHFAGQAITVKAVPGDNLAVFGALAEIRPGDVLIIDWRGHIGSSVNGASMLVAPRVDGLEAVVVDGGVRDVAEVASLGIPLFGRAVSASAPGKREIGEVNVPVSCGGVVVEPGDIVFGGGEGVVVIPRGDLERVLAVLTPYVAPATLADWPLEERRSRSLARVEQYRAALAEAVERTASPS
jgi:regulator of RNase E activity RraA